MTNLTGEQFEEMIEAIGDQQEEDRQFLIGRGWRKAEEADYINDKWAKKVETWVHPNGELYPLCKLFGTEKTQAIDKAYSEFTRKLGWKGCGTLAKTICYGEDYVQASYLHPVSGKCYLWFEMLEIALDLDNDDTRMPHDHLCSQTHQVQEILKDKTVEENDIVDLDFRENEEGNNRFYFVGIRKNVLPLSKPE